MAIKLSEDIKMIHDKKKPFNYMIGKDRIHLFIFNFENPIKKKTHEKTLYYFFNAQILTRDGEKIPAGKHTIQLPAKTVVYQLYHMLKDMNKLDDIMINVTIIKKDNYNYDITVHN